MERVAREQLEPRRRRSFAEPTPPHARVASVQANGPRIARVPFAIGADDVQCLFLSTAFATAAPQAQQQMVTQVFATVQTNYLAALTQIHQLLPRAKTLLLDYYNPFAIFGPANVYNANFTTLPLAYRNMIMNLAPQFDAAAVDLLGPFAGHELA